jgi:molybdopterin molybdotransferase
LHAHRGCRPRARSTPAFSPSGHDLRALLREGRSDEDITSSHRCHLAGARATAIPKSAPPKRLPAARSKCPTSVADGTAFAGRAFEGKVGAGETVRIMTGAVLPEGVDTVVIQEVTKVEGDAVIIPPASSAGQNTRRAGEDLQAGKPAIPAGRKLRPAEIGIVASLGVAEVSVRRRLRVALFSTGDELCSIGEPLTEGAVYDSNRYTLWGMLTRLGCEVIDMGVVSDDPAALEAAFRDAAACADVIITSGGVSVGEADFIKQLMAQLGEVAFWKIAMKPGRPMAFGRIASRTAPTVPAPGCSACPATRWR